MFFFTKKSVGLDIADHTIEVVELERKGKTMKVSSKGRVLLENGVVQGGRIKNKEELLKAVKKAFSKAKPRPIIAETLIFGLPETQAYLHIFEFGPNKKEERENLILTKIQENIPLKKDDLLFSFKVLSEQKDKTEILVLAASKEVISEWQQLFQELGMEVKAFDTESLAVFRGLFVKKNEVPVCLVDIGAVTTNVAIFDKTGLRYSHSFKGAGQALTEEIADVLKIKPKEAEKIKIEIGLSDRNNQIFQILIKNLELINKEVKSLINYFQEKTKQKVKEVILIGGSSRLKGIVEYFNINLELPVKIGKTKFLKEKVPLEYIEAVGLALRGIDKKWVQNDPALYLEAVPLSQALNPEQKKEKIFLEKIREIKAKLNKKKILLLIIVPIVALAAFGLNFCFKNLNQQKKEPVPEVSPAPSTQPLEPETEKEEQKEPQEEITELVIIKETGVGWLRVREGPGTNYPEITKVYPGESYPLLEESEEWYKIEIEKGKEGWIFSQHAQKQ